MKRIRLAVAGVAGVAVASVAVTGSALATADALAPKKFTVSATEYRFKFVPLATARKNQKVVVTLVNRGSEVHDLKFQGIAPKSRFIPAGGRSTFTVVFKKAGRYKYVCTIGEHAIKGMQGVFIVKA